MSGATLAPRRTRSPLVSRAVAATWLTLSLLSACSGGGGGATGNNNGQGSGQNTPLIWDSGKWDGTNWQ
jgi:hypothetical protein